MGNATMQEIEFFDVEVLRRLEIMDIDTARSTSIELIKTSRTKAAKKQHLIRDLTAAPSAREVSRIMWNTMLAGNGLSIMGSKWQEQHG